MNRLVPALLALVIALAVPAAASAQTTPASVPPLVYAPTTRVGMPLLSYQSPNGKVDLSVGWWFGRGQWMFTGPVEARAGSNLIMIDIRYVLSGPWVLAFDYAYGSWYDITFNGAPAPPSLSGSVSMGNVDLRYRLGSGTTAKIEAILGYQFYRPREDDSATASSDEARAGGFRVGFEAMVPLRGPWGVRAMAVLAPVGVTETFISGAGAVPTITSYTGTFTDASVAVSYTANPTWTGEVGYRAQRANFRRPADTLEHTLEGWFLHFVYRR